MAEQETDSRSSRAAGDSDEAEAPEVLRGPALLLVALLAALPRCLNLGTFSMWLDEVLQTRMASHSLRDLWTALQSDVVHPPLDGVLTWLLLEVDASETMRRMVPVVFGILTVVLLARWASERYGRGVGLVTGLLAALSPIHIHYSQELRPYSLALFFFVATLWCFDWLMRSPGSRQWVLLGLCLLGAFYSLYLSAVILVPLFVMGVGAGLRKEGPFGDSLWSGVRGMALLGASVALAFTPWLRVVVALSSREVEKAAHSWSWDHVLRRLEHLTVGGLEGDPATWRVWFPVVLGLLGTAVAVRRRGGLVLLAGVLVGTVGVEVMLWQGNHWSNDRYSLMGWPFLCVVLALGVTQLGRGRTAKPAVLLLVLALSTLQLQGIRLEYLRGRPHWDWVARVVTALARPGDSVFVVNDWTRVCLDYYLERIGEGGDKMELKSGTAKRFSDTRQGPGCGFLVTGGYPSGWPLVRAASPRTLLAVDPGGLETRVFGMIPSSPERVCTRDLPADLRERPRPMVGSWRSAPNPRAVPPPGPE